MIEIPDKGGPLYSGERVSPEDKERLLQRIQSLGFEPFPYPAGAEQEHENNPGRIVPPSSRNPDDWLTVSQASQLTSKVPRTISRWEILAKWINFTDPVKGSVRDDDRHFIYRDDFMHYLSIRKSIKANYLSDELVDEMSDVLSTVREGYMSDQMEGRSLQNNWSKGMSAVQEDVVTNPAFRKILLALSTPICQEVEGAIGRKLRKERVLLLAGAGAIAGILLACFGFLVGIQRERMEQQWAKAQESYSKEVQTAAATLKDQLGRLELQLAREGRDRVFVVEHPKEKP